MECNADHDQHLCMKIARRTPLEELKPLIKDAKFICKNCGRAAADAKSICAPEEL